jgi:hypothetical protein
MRARHDDDTRLAQRLDLARHVGARILKGRAAGIAIFPVGKGNRMP